MRDGISNGRESNFQSSFDEGFRYGYFNGYAMGRYKAALQIKNISPDKTLNNPRAGWCYLCDDKSTQNVADCIQQQMDKANKNFEHLDSIYSGKIDVDMGKIRMTL